MIINNLPFKAHHFLENLVKETSGSLKKDCLEHVFERSKELGKGSITGFSFGEGIELLLFNCEFHKDIVILFEKHAVAPIQINFLVQGGVKHFFNNNYIQYYLNPLEGTITADVFDSKNGFEFPQNQKIVLASLMIDRKKYINKIDCLIDKMPERLAAVFLDMDAKEPFLYQGNYSITSSECIQKILQDEHKGLVRSTYLEGVTLELLSCQIKQFKDSTLPQSKQVALRKYDVERIFEAKEILLERIKEPPTIKTLAKLVGLNQTKLKAGFKAVFDKPVKTWLRDRQLEIARLLILEQEMSIRNIAETVGYKNQSHFSKRFQEKYGILPKNFAQEMKIKLNDYK